MASEWREGGLCGCTGPPSLRVQWIQEWLSKWYIDHKPVRSCKLCVYVEGFKDMRLACGVQSANGQATLSWRWVVV